MMFDETVCTPFPYDKTLLLWVTYTTANKKVWYVTSDKMRTEYQLWKGSKKTKWSSDNPLDLNKYIK